MTLGFDENFFIAFIFVTVRFGAWLAIAPPFQGAVPGRARAGLAMAMGLGMAPALAAQGDLPDGGSWDLMAGLIYQASIGLILGFVVYLLFQAVSAAGGMIDAFAALTSGQLFDPLANTAVGPVSRFYQMLGIAVLFAIDGHLMMVGGLMRTFDAAPVGGLNTGQIGRILTHDFGLFLLSAVQIAAPVLAALFVTELMLGLATRAAPKLNILVLGFGAKSLVLFLILGAALPLIPFVLKDLIGTMLKSMAAISGG